MELDSGIKIGIEAKETDENYKKISKRQSKESKRCLYF